MLQKLLRMPGFLRAVSRMAHGLSIPALHTPWVVLVFSWKQVNDVLSRDNDFRVAPLYRDKMRSVAGDFFLGLDRCPLSFKQRDCSGRAMARSTHGLTETIREAAEAALEDHAPLIDVIADYARPIATSTAIFIFGVRAPKDDQLMAATRDVFEQVFLNLGNRDPEVEARGIAAGRSIRRWTLDEIDRRRDSGERPADMLTYLMARPELSDTDRAAAVAGHLVGAIDTTTTAFAYIIYEILTRPNLHHKVAADLDDLTRLRGWCFDILRRRPQAPFLPRRTGATAVSLGGRSIAPGTLVLAVTSAAHHDPNVFIDPDRFEPGRALDAYFHFGAGPHLCSGVAINDLQLPILLQTLLRKSPRGCGKLIYDGPFPSELMVRFRGGL